jgi:hypothetical protein
MIKAIQILALTYAGIFFATMAHYYIFKKNRK